MFTMKSYKKIIELFSLKFKSIFQYKVVLWNEQITKHPNIAMVGVKVQFKQIKFKAMAQEYWIHDFITTFTIENPDTDDCFEMGSTFNN